MTTLSVIVPTTGRDTLTAALESVADADEVLVIDDRARSDRGYTARHAGMALARGTHLAFLDDDDVFAEDAVDVMRDLARRRPVIFRMDDPLHGVLWRDPELRYANVGTPMFLVPNDPARLGRWEPHPHDPGRGGDFVFIRGCCERMGAPVWREEVVAVVRPHERGTVPA